MIKKIEILGITLDNYSVQESMRQVELFLNNDVMNTIEDVTMDMLVHASSDESLKECIEQLDLAVVSDKEILNAAGVTSLQRIRETVEHQFFHEFMRRIIRNRKSVYLIGETAAQVETLTGMLRDEYEHLRLIGGYAIESCGNDYDNAVNEINVASPDVIFSVLSTPQQEYFLKENKKRMNAKIWYGIGKNLENAAHPAGVSGFLRRLLHRGVLKSMMSQYEKQEKEE